MRLIQHDLLDAWGRQQKSVSKEILKELICIKLKVLWKDTCSRITDKKHLFTAIVADESDGVTTAI